MEMQKVTVLSLEDFPGENVPRFEAWREASLFGRVSKELVLGHALMASVFIKYKEGAPESYYLEKAFELTQNGYDDWSQYNNVTSHIGDSPRSSSVGDAMVLNGVVYVVGMIGFDRIK